MGIYIAVYDGGVPGQIWPEPEGKGITFLEDCYNFGTDPQGCPFFFLIGAIWLLQVDLEQQLGHL